jgi:hypothetical protein
MSKFKLEIRAGIAIVAGLLMMGGARLVGANTALSTALGMISLIVVGLAFLIAGSFDI